jgi:hypothetical protein
MPPAPAAADSPFRRLQPHLSNLTGIILSKRDIIPLQPVKFLIFEARQGQYATDEQGFTGNAFSIFRSEDFDI